MPCRVDGRTVGEVSQAFSHPDEHDLGDGEQPTITDADIHRVIDAEVLRSRQEPVHVITDADPGLTTDQRSRMRRYAIAMGIRTLCFVLCVVTPSPWRWGFAIGAVVLPYFAVIIANAGRERRDADTVTFLGIRRSRRALPGGD